MGLDLFGVRLLLNHINKGNSVTQLATLGRHQFQMMEHQDLIAAAKKQGKLLTELEVQAMYEECERYADPFYKWMGAEAVHSYDFSDYEKATHLWDMNDALPEAAAGKYDLVYDGGTLEHIFHASVALREVMCMPKVGGYLIGGNPCNSFVGHGFYQFSPDFYFQAFRPENGYEIEAVYMVEEKCNAVFHEVAKPSRERGRALLSSFWPIQIFYVAKRIGEVPAKLKGMQPDYEDAWADGGLNESNQTIRRSISFLDQLPIQKRNHLLRRLKMAYLFVTGKSFIQPRCFIPREEI